MDTPPPQCERRPERNRSAFPLYGALGELHPSFISDNDDRSGHHWIVSVATGSEDQLAPAVVVT